MVGILDWLASSGVKRVRFTGGEPLLRKDVGKLALHAKSRGFLVGLNTNGYLVAQRLADLENFDFILISVASATASTTDAVFRHKGSHRQKVKALTLLSQHPNLWVSTVLTPQSISELDSIAEWLQQFGISRWILLRPEPNGCGLALDLSGLKHTLSVIRLISKQMKFRISLGNALPLCADVDDEDQETLRELLIQGDGGIVSEGRSKLVINPSGQVLVHYAIEQPVGTIFGDLGEVFAHPISRAVRGTEDLPHSCLSCLDLSICGGGSRLAALASKDRSLVDPLMGSRYRSMF